MGEWFHVEVRWTGAVPSERACADLSELLALLDADTRPDGVDPWDNGVRITHQGATGCWRNPTLGLSELLALFHAYGFACKGRWRLWSWERGLGQDEELALLQESPWISSVPDLGWLAGGYDAQRRFLNVRDFSRRFARYLPAVPASPPASLPRRRGPHRRARSAASRRRGGRGSAGGLGSAPRASPDHRGEVISAWLSRRRPASRTAVR
jgi:hypothetical protein